MSYGLGSVSSMQMMDTVKTNQVAHKEQHHVEKSKDQEHSDKKVDANENKDVVTDKVLMERARQQANEVLKGYDRYVERQVHEVTHAITYKLKDALTDEVLLEFPPEKIQDMVAKMWELAGLFVDKEA